MFSTYNILKNLPSTKLYVDGVGLSFGGWEWNWRLSSVIDSANDLINGAMALGKSTASLAGVGLGVTALANLPGANATEIKDDLPVNFRHTNPITGEMINFIVTGRTNSPSFVETFRQMLVNCTHLIATPQDGKYRFTTVKIWPYDGWPDNILEFAREVGKNVTEAENCIIRFLDYAVQLIKNEDEQTRELLWTGLGSTLAIIGLIGGGIVVYAYIERNNHRHRANHTAEEEGRLIPPQTTQPENYGATQSNTAAPIEKTNAERLDGIDCEVDNVFICPITEEIFTDPVVTNFGHTYERVAIEKWMLERNNQCPFKSGPITSINPVINLRNKAKEFVEQQEKIHQSQSNNISRTLKK